MSRAARLRQRTSLPRAVCPVCNRERSCMVPRGGDGSVWVYRLHRHEGQRCEGSRRDVHPDHIMSEGYGWEGYP